MDYKEKLKDKRWISFSKKVKKYNNNECMTCGSKLVLCAHHRYYNKNEMGFYVEPWDYDYKEDMWCLCKSCHDMYHFIENYDEIYSGRFDSLSNDALIWVSAKIVHRWPETELSFEDIFFKLKSNIINETKNELEWMLKRKK